jgi:hypothetical protein
VVLADRPSARNRDMLTILNHRCDRMWAGVKSGFTGMTGLRRAQTPT